MTMDPSFELYGMPGHLIRRLQGIANAIFIQQTDGSGVSPPQYAALLAVQAFPGINQLELARTIAFDRSTIQEMVIRLEEKGLIRREDDPEDRRQRVLFLTDSGRKKLAAMKADNARAQDLILHPLTAKERAVLMRLIARMVETNNDISRTPQYKPPGSAAAIRRQGAGTR